MLKVPSRSYLVCVKSKYPKSHIVGNVYSVINDKHAKGIYITCENSGGHRFQALSYFNIVRFVTRESLTDEDLFALKIGASL